MSSEDKYSIKIDLATLSGLVRAASQNPLLVVHDWQIERLHGGFQLNSSIFRLHGNALTAEKPAPWSLVIKVIRPDLVHESPDDYRYWKREALAYHSGALNELTGLLVAPRCYDVIDQPDGSQWVVMEDLHSDSSSPWTLEQYANAARCIGEFNGTYLAGRPLPAGDWTARNWLCNYLQHAAPAVDFIRTNTHHPLVLGIFPGNTLAQILTLWDLHPRLLHKLDSLPQTFCHQDAFERNLFLRNGGVVAIDWGYTGISPIGSDLTPLISAALGMGGFPSQRAQELDNTCFNAYIGGLRQAGYKPDVRQARLGYLLTFVLRYLLGNAVGETIPSLLDPERRERILENIAIPNPEDIKSDPGNIGYSQRIVFELLKQLGPVFTLETLARALSYQVRLLSKQKN